MFSFDKTSESKIKSIVFNGLCDHSHHIKKVMCRDVCDSTLELWHAIDIKDFSTFRSFVVPSGGDLYDIDFLSRHEILPPMSIKKLPNGWESWAQIYKNQLIITNREEFCCRMMTPDAVVALPTYRFEFLADDIRSEMENGLNISDSLSKVLEYVLTGYSYQKFSKFEYKTEPNLVFKLFDSIKPVDK